MNESNDTYPAAEVMVTDGDQIFDLSVAPKDLLAYPDIIENVLPSIQIGQAHEAEYWTGFVGQANKLLKDYEAHRDIELKPKKEEYDQLRDMYNMPLKKAEAIVAVIKSKILSFKMYEKKRALEASRAGEVQELPSTMVKAEATTATTVKNYKFKIVDPSLIPSEYYIIDEKKIGAVVRGGLRHIPGVEIYAEESLVIKNK